MGRGGGGSHSHSHSHHSSSHSHHSSGGHRSSYSGGSSRSSHRSSYHHSGGSYSGGSGGGGCSGCFSSIIALMMPVALFAVFFIFFAVKTGNAGDLGIERSTIQREPLPSSKCDYVDEWYRDDWGDWIDESGEKASLISGMREFYDATGVQPYLYIMGEEGKDYKSEGSLEEYAENKYKELFGDDEGHLLVVFREYPNASSNYIVTVTPGHDAEAAVMDEQAREILLDYIDYYYSNQSLNEGQFFSRSFEKAASRIMTKQMSLRAIVTIIVIAVIVGIALIIVISVVRKSKEKVAKQKALQAKEQADKARSEADKAQTEFRQQQYYDELEKEYVAVTCPNCGAAGNKIRKLTVGYCEFCGSAIKVDENGNPYTVTPDSTSDNGPEL